MIIVSLLKGETFN